MMALLLVVLSLGRGRSTVQILLKQLVGVFYFCTKPRLVLVGSEKTIKQQQKQQNIGKEEVKKKSKGEMKTGVSHNEGGTPRLDVE